MSVYGLVSTAWARATLLSSRLHIRISPYPHPGYYYHVILLWDFAVCILISSYCIKAMLPLLWNTRMLHLDLRCMGLVAVEDICKELQTKK